METKDPTNRAETLKQQSRETAPVSVVRDVTFHASKPHLSHRDPTSGSRGKKCGPELVGAVVAEHNLVRSAHRPYSADFGEAKVGGGVP